MINSSTSSSSIQQQQQRISHSVSVLDDIGMQEAYAAVPRVDKPDVILELPFDTSSNDSQ